MTAPAHQKDLVKLLCERFGEPFSAATYRDSNGKRPLYIGEFGPLSNRFYSTIGICDKSLPIPSGRYELAALGKLKWLPNALASSVYWLKDRAFDTWPLVCEDVVLQNAKSTYRHMAYIPSKFSCVVSAGPPIQWLLGIPISDSETSINYEEALEKAVSMYPGWLFNNA